MLSRVALKGSSSSLLSLFAGKARAKSHTRVFATRVREGKRDIFSAARDEISFYMICEVKCQEGEGAGYRRRRGRYPIAIECTQSGKWDVCEVPCIICPEHAAELFAASFSSRTRSFISKRFIRSLLTL